MKYFRINYYRPGVHTMMPMYTNVMAGSARGAEDTFYTWFPDLKVCHVEDAQHPYSVNGTYSRYFKRS